MHGCMCRLCVHNYVFMGTFECACVDTSARMFVSVCVCGGSTLCLQVCMCVNNCVSILCLFLCVRMHVCVCVCYVTQVHIDEINNRFISTRLGVVTTSPDTFTLPGCSLISNPAVLCVCDCGVLRFGQWVSFDIVICLLVDGCLLAGLVPW